MRPFLLPFRFQWILAGLCLGLAFLHPFLSPLIIVGLVLLIQIVVSSQSVQQAALCGFVIGIFKFTLVLIWISDTYPLNWLGSTNFGTQMLLISSVYIINVLCLSLSVAALTTLLYLASKKDYRNIFFFPFFVIATEVLGSILFSIYSLGPGSKINIDFSFGYVGYAFSNLPLMLPTAVLGGVYVLSFLAALSSLILYLWWFKKYQDHYLFKFQLAALLLLVGISNIYLIARPEKELNQEIIAVSTYFSAELLSNSEGVAIKRSSILEAATTALNYDPDIVLLPEDSRLVSNFNTKEEIFQYLSGSQTIVVDSSRAPNGENVTLRAYLLDLQDQEVHIIDKQKLVPQGEYLPYLFSFLLNMTGKESFVKKVLTDRSYTPGPANSYEELSENAPRILFCFESVSPLGIKSLILGSNSEFILHPVSHAWFHDSSVLRYQLDRMLRIQAVSNNTIIVQAGNMASSKMYKTDGNTDFGELVGTGKYFSLHQF